MQVTEASIKYVQDIAKLENEAMGYFKALEFAQKILENQELNVYIAREEDTFLGYIVFNTADKDCGTIDYFAVVKQHRRKGIGKALLDHVILDAKRKAYKKIALEVRKTNAPAIILYSKKGFVVTGAQEKEANGEKIIKLTMEKPL